MSKDPVILWFRRDLRLSDQAALASAADEGPVVPVFVLDDETPGDRKPGGASRWWLHRSLESLAGALAAKGSRLILRRGRVDHVLPQLCQETGATRVHALRHYEPWWKEAEDRIADQVDLCLHDGNYLEPPGAVTTGAGEPYKIFTPFWRALKERMPPPEPRPRPRRIETPSDWPESDDLEAWGLLPTHPNWASAMEQEWEPGEEGALKRLRAFEDEASRYEGQRNCPSLEGTSKLSPHLHWGEISPARVYDRVKDAGGSVGTFLSELGWRDFSQNVIHQFPNYPDRSYRDFDAFEWRDFRSSTAREDFEAWKAGRTGYPIVDAGMRQLWAIGWIHNRVRMIVASFLIKHLLIDWREGERWFWDTLVDADYGSNGTNWQWVAGTGVDSNMFVRIMAPLSQSEKYAAGDYIRQWVPELADLPDAAIHDPHAAGCAPSDYPEKRIGHKQARDRALSAYREMKAG
ncbi:cryptochrome/photolyase family protein [Sphingomicrobium astaxanthinifaciens]|uniref:cryptochrome/photolyase family protein n=1 Tax=Sphingomicrobium astaxanthinifaciens TaxID=1227949 RepID=UPI001FCBD818|nr:deoxyribodipyrimidine photo-lyase [Sphingomicrobium astaxanthinifaciens]MCJ7420646.1 DNA photolyase family protein [Sphingomicrobium astaxanthinifaciens]